MAEGDNGGSSDFAGMLKKKLGPFPVGVWAALVIIFVIIAFKFFQKKAQESVAGQPGSKKPGSDLSSLADLQNAFPVAAGMPFSNTVFVNGPGQSTAPGPKYPPTNIPPVGPGQIGGYWYLTPRDMFGGEISQLTYGTQDVGASDQATTAIAVERMVRENPQLDWSRRIPGGTPVYISPAPGGDVAKRYALPQGAVQSIQGTAAPTQQSTMITAV